MKYLRAAIGNSSISEVAMFGHVLYELLAAHDCFWPILIVCDDPEFNRALNLFSRSQGKFYACTEEEEKELMAGEVSRTSRSSITLNGRVLMSEETDCLIVYNQPGSEVREILEQAEQKGIEVVNAQLLDDASLTREMIRIRRQMFSGGCQTVIITWNEFVNNQVLRALISDSAENMVTAVVTDHVGKVKLSKLKIREQSWDFDGLSSVMGCLEGFENVFGEKYPPCELSEETAI